MRSLVRRPVAYLPDQWAQQRAVQASAIKIPCTFGHSKTGTQTLLPGFEPVLPDSKAGVLATTLQEPRPAVSVLLLALKKTHKGT